MQAFVGHRRVVALAWRLHLGEVAVLPCSGILFLQCLCLLGGDNLYHVGLLVAERHLITHNLVFHGVLQWGVEQHLHHLTLDESHLDNTLAESTMSEHLYDNSFFTCA